MFNHTLLSKYNIWIYQVYSSIKQHKSDDSQIDNYDLAKIFELYSCIQLSNKYNQLFYHYDDIDPSFKELNKMSQNDTGIDACNLVDTIVQAKLRKNGLTWSDCSTFFASRVSYSEQLKQPIIKWNNLIITRNSECKLSNNLLFQKDLFVDQTYSRESIIDYCNKLIENPPTIPKENIKFELRDYQIESVDLIKNNNKNIIICLPTGCGKNVVIIHSFKEKGKYLILVPRIILLEQLKDEIIKFYPTLKTSIQTIGDGDTKFDTKKSITICVYNSVHNLEPYIKSFTKIYVDEAHHIIKPDIYTNFSEDASNDGENTGEDEDNLVSSNYLTIIKSFQKYNNNVYLSATIDQQSNFLFYKKDIRDMITSNHLVDYTLHIPVFNNDPTNKNICEYLLSKYLHLILYCNSQKEGSELNTLLNQLQKGCSEYIDCTTPKKKRNEIIGRYKEGKLKFLVNVRILVEGFDAPITKGVCFMHLPSSKTTIIQIIGRALRLHPEKTIANIILPYSTKEDENNINNFLKVLSLNDSRIRETYKKKKLGGYINIVKSNKNNDISNEENEESELIELRYEEIYNHLGECLNRKKFTPEEKGEYLLEYVNKENKVPLQKYIHKIVIDEIEYEISLGRFYSSLKSGQSIEILDNLINRSDIIKQDVEDYFKYKDEKKKEFTVEEKGTYLLEYVNKENKLPSSKYIHKVIIDNKEYEINLGQFYTGLKYGYNNKLLIDLINKNNIIKQDIERYNNTKEEKKSEKEFTLEEKTKYLLEYVIKENKVPLQKYIHKILIENKEYEINLGQFYSSLKAGQSKEILINLISKNDIIKQDVERYNKTKEEKKNNKDFTLKEKVKYLLEYVIKENKVPSQNYIHKIIIDNKEYEINLGQFYSSLKAGQSKEILIDLINENDTIKQNIEEYNKTKEDKKNNKEFTLEEKVKYLLEYVNKEKKTPIAKYVCKVTIENKEYELKLGIFYDGMKQGHNNKTLNKLINENNIIKQDIENYNKTKEENKDKRVFTPAEKAQYLFDYVNKEKKVPSITYIHKVIIDNKEYEISLGKFLQSSRQGCNKDILHDLMKKNDIIKQYIENYNKTKEENKDKRVFTPVEKGQYLLDYIKKEKKIPSAKCVHKVIIDNKEYKINLGRFYTSLKSGHNKEILNDLINKNDIIKQNIKEYLKNK
jgi:superfamily II DNA or RNA helicase